MCIVYLRFTICGYKYSVMIASRKLIEESMSKGLQVDYSDYFMENPEKITKLLGNLCWGRSGSYLMCSLFDFHPQILALPPHSYASTMVKLPELAAEFYDLGTKEIIKKMLDVFPCATREGNRREPWSLINAAGTFVKKLGDTDEVDMGPPEDKFYDVCGQIIERFKEKKKRPNAAILINMVHIAYSVALGRKLPSKNLGIFLSLHGRMPQIIEMLSKSYKNFYLMINIRHPLLTHDSHFFHHFFENIEAPLIKFVSVLQGHLANDGLKSPGIRDSHQFCVRFEDMHKNPEGITRAICDLFKIEWDPILLESTIDGKTLWVERPGRIFTGTNPKAAEKESLALLRKGDVVFLEYVLKNYYKEFGYQTKYLSDKQGEPPLFDRLRIRYFPWFLPICRRAFVLDLRRFLKNDSMSRRQKLKQSIRYLLGYRKFVTSIIKKKDILSGPRVLEAKEES